LLGSLDQSGHLIRVKYLINKRIATSISKFEAGVNFVTIDSSEFDLTYGLIETIEDQDDWRVGLDPDEYTSDIRLIDDKTGNLNKTLIEGLVSTLRPANERYYLRYVDFQDTFRDPILNWEIVTGDPVVDTDEGELTLDNSIIKTEEVNDTTWTEIVAGCIMKLENDSTWAEFRFYYTDEDNFYCLRMDPSTKTLSLEKEVTGVRTVLDSEIIPYFRVGVYHSFSVQTSDTGAGHSIKYFSDQNLVNEITDLSFTEGKLALASDNGQITVVRLVELFQNPLQSVRIGPTSPNV
jgi:hypothetical protein